MFFLSLLLSLSSLSLFAMNYHYCYCCACFYHSIFVRALLSPFTVNSAKLIINPYLAKNTKKETKKGKGKYELLFLNFNHLFYFFYILYLHYTYFLHDAYTTLACITYNTYITIQLHQSN